jgi:hypothetical protein
MTIIHIMGKGCAPCLLSASSFTIPRKMAIYLHAQRCELSVWDGKPGNHAQDFFGRASYHLFIAHMPIAVVLVTGLKFTPDSVLVCLTTVIIELALSAGLVPIERYINLMRQRIHKVQKGVRRRDRAR